MHGRPTPRLAAIVACLSLIATSARAQRRRDDAEDRSRALELFRQSEQAYRGGRFSDAASLLREAYGIHPEPILQYNLARALEGMGDRQGAVTAYEHYLSEATQVEDRGAILQRVATLRREIAEREALEHQRTEAERGREEAEARLEREQASERSAGTEPAPRARARDDGGPSAVPWIIAGAGVAALGVGAFFGLQAQSEHDDAVAQPVQLDASRAQDSAESSALIANVCFITGGVLVATGVTWGIVDLASGGGDEDSDAELTLRIVPGGLALLGRIR